MNYNRSTVYLTAFLRRYLPHLAAWTPAGALAWVQWFCDHGLALVVKDGLKIESAVLFRRVATADEVSQPYAHNPAAPIVYVDACVARKRSGLKPLFSFFYAREGGHCQEIAWLRSKHNNRPFRLKIEDAARRFSYG